MEPSVFPEGVLIFEPEVKVLRTISPTRYVSIQGCPMREVWSASEAQALLPSSPAARIGTAIHRLLEEAGQGAVQVRDIDSRWNELVSTVESEMRFSWLERHLVPLRNSVPDFEVRRLQARERATQLSQNATAVTSSHGAGGTSRYGGEIPVSSQDGSVKGRIDEVTASTSGPVLRDYKSGAIFERLPKHAHVLKSAYEIQLKMYAALYFETVGVWPVGLEVVPILGSSQQVDLDKDSCKALVEDAKRVLKAINETVLNAVSPLALQSSLARPKQDSCMYCPYRPGCAPYAHSAEREPICPGDVSGKLMSVERLSGGSELMTLQDGHQLVNIRGLSGDVRHPALRILQPGDQVAVYGLKSTGSPLSFVESRFTTIYQVPEDAGSLGEPSLVSSHP